MGEFPEPYSHRELPVPLAVSLAINYRDCAAARGGRAAGATQRGHLRRVLLTLAPHQAVEPSTEGVHALTELGDVSLADV
ncbi:MAG: hypothetical protein ACM3ZE_16845, partial [Myxococcales bacterium]